MILPCLACAIANGVAGAESVGRESHYGWGDFERAGPRRYRISKGPRYHYRPQVDTEQVGDLLDGSRLFQ